MGPAKSICKHRPVEVNQVLAVRRPQEPAGGWAKLGKDAKCGRVIGPGTLKRCWGLIGKHVLRESVGVLQCERVLWAKSKPRWRGCDRDLSGTWAKPTAVSQSEEVRCECSGGWDCFQTWWWLGEAEVAPLELCMATEAAMICGCYQKQSVGEMLRAASVHRQLEPCTGGGAIVIAAGEGRVVVVVQLVFHPIWRPKLLARRRSIQPPAAAQQRGPSSAERGEASIPRVLLRLASPSITVSLSVAPSVVHHSVCSVCSAHRPSVCHPSLGTTSTLLRSFLLLHASCLLLPCSFAAS